MNIKKKITGKKAASGVVAVFAAATLAFFGLNGNTAIETKYEIIKGDKVAELVIYPPEDVGVDIVELYCNESLVTKTLLPEGRLKSIPLVFSDLKNLELKLYKRGKVEGIGKFDEDKLYIVLKDGGAKNEK